ncbi:MAG TPA: hypothetical protein VNH83_12110 [Bryobacteraceae bacterium]|nr:hypothetical protein [Bryobacteraceae bacterium]
MSSFPVPWSSLPAGASPGSHVVDQTNWEAIRTALRTDSANRNGGAFNYANVGDIAIARIFSKSGGQTFALSDGHDFVTQAQGASATQGQFAVSTSGGTITAGVTTTATIAPVPPGINHTNTDHYIRIFAGTGSPEIVKITGGTAIAGSGTGTITFVSANNHSGAWKLMSATAGIQEALWEMGSGVVLTPAISPTLYAPIRRVAGDAQWVRGAGMTATALNVDPTFPLVYPGGSTPVRGVFDWSPGDAAAVTVGGASDLSINFPQPDQNNLTTPTPYTHWPPAIYSTGTYHTLWERIQIIAGWDGCKIVPNINGAHFRHIHGSCFHRMFDFDGALDEVSVDWCENSTLGLTANQITCFLDPATANVFIYSGDVAGLMVASSFAATAFCDLHLGASGFGGVNRFINCWADSGGITHSNGNTEFIGCEIGANFVTFSGGWLTMNSCVVPNATFGTAIASSYLNGNASFASSFKMVNCHIDSGAYDTNPILACSTSGSYTGTFTVQIHNNGLSRAPNLTYVKPTIDVLGTSVGETGHTIINADGNYLSDLGSGTGYMFFITDDEAHNIGVCNRGLGWTNSFPATAAKGLYPYTLVNTAVASASTITPTGPLFHVTGTATIQSITFPTGFPYRRIGLIADAVWALGTSGDIGAALTAVVGRLYYLEFDPVAGKWYPIG